MHLYIYANICSANRSVKVGKQHVKISNKHLEACSKRDFYTFNSLPFVFLTGAVTFTNCLSVLMLITVTECSVNRDAQIFFPPTDPFSSTLRFLMIPIHHCDVYPQIKRRYVSDKSARPN